MFLKNQEDTPTFIQFRSHSEFESAHENKHSLFLMLCALTLITALSAYSTLFIADSSSQEFVGEGFPTIEFISEPESASHPIQLWNCLGNYTTDPAGNAICIGITPDERIDAQGEKYITTSSF